MMIFCNQGASVVCPFELLRVEWVVMEKLYCWLYYIRVEQRVLWVILFHEKLAILHCGGLLLLVSVL